MLTCPQCGEENPERARFCLACGSSLGAPDHRRMERKYATALFADLVGSTSLAEREDPEVVQSVVGRSFDRLAEEIARYEGLLEKFMGDAVLAVFGVPRSHEDDAERAVRAAMAMQAVLSELNEGFAVEGKPRLAMRIGVEAGEVLVDLERASGPRDRMLTGDAVNTAARLQTAAEPGRIVVGAGVYAVTKDVVEYRELPALDLKGKSEPVRAWEALRIKAKQRGERPQLGMEARLVGRDEEITVLKQTLLRVQTQGRAALVTIVGPAGVGKTRLVRELERHVDALPEQVYWRRGRCLSYGNASYSALADAVKAQCEILEDDASDVATKKVENTLKELLGETSLAPEICALVGAGEPGQFTREDLFEAWRRFLERMAARYPLVLVFEDIMWADEGLLDFIEHAADWAQGRILIVALARPELFELRPSWGGGKRNTASIYLEPLTPAESSAMVEDLLSGDLTLELSRAIAERSEGNPLYVEEIVRKLIDDGVLRETGGGAGWEVAKPLAEVELPRSIQALIAARLDVLPEDEKALLQDAAVIGRVFWTGAVTALGDRELPEVRETLGRLRVKELVVPNEPSSFSGEHEFAFRHGLIRDGAYDTLPKSLRAAKHVQVARWAEERAGDRAEEIAELIATHDLEALGYLEELGDISESRADLERSAYRWTRAAAERAVSMWLRSEAVRWYEETMRLADQIGEPVAERAVLAREHASTVFGAFSAEEAEGSARRALALFEEAKDELGSGWAQAALVTPLFQQGRDEEAFGNGEQALARLEPLGESLELADALHILGQFHWRRGHSEIADTYLRRAVDVARRVGAQVTLARATQTLGLELAQTGNVVEALATMEDAFRLAKSAGDLTNLLRIYNNFPAILSDFASDYERAEEISREGLEVAKRAGAIGFVAWIGGGLGEISAARGELAEGERLIRISMDDAKLSGDEPLIGMRLGTLASLLLFQGRIDEAGATLEAAEETMRDKPEPQAEIQSAWVAGQLALARDRPDVAAIAFRRGVAIAAEYNVDQEPRLFVDLIRLLVDGGEREEAEHHLATFGRAGSPFAKANLLRAAGLLATDHGEGLARIREAVAVIERLGLRPELGRALLDLGRAQRRAGEDPRPAFERARALFVECGAGRFLPEAEAELATSS